MALVPLLRILKAAAAEEGESLGTWLRGLAVRAAMEEKNFAAAPENGVRTERWTSRATAGQKKSVTNSARELKLTVSDYVRAVGLARAKELGVR